MASPLAAWHCRPLAGWFGVRPARPSRRIPDEASGLRISRVGLEPRIINPAKRVQPNRLRWFPLQEEDLATRARLCSRAMQSSYEVGPAPPESQVDRFFGS